jgi:hypothetical protein
MKTSEGKLTLASTLIAAALAVLAIWFPDLPREELREVLLWIAGLLSAGTTAAYSMARAQVKKEIARATREELARPDGEGR